MSNSHEQSLNEDVIFLPVSETSPDFLYSETERLALERLLNAGPEAFYSTVGSEHSSCFLSPEEVTDLTNWVQDYHLTPLPKEEHGDNGPDLGFEGYSSTYYPAHSDTPAPGLALGWPERNPWGQKDTVKVYTSPPAEGAPSVRELIRQHLQTATQVIAIVTDRLTDCTVIGDLHNAASRGVAVYIILNQRSTHESTLHRLRHPNMQVRVLGGKSFCSRAGRMVVGEMKDKFVLVDLQTVIHGSYSLTWSDVHLHRQLVTVLTGSVIDSFDQEFRILFAASSPVPEPRRSSGSQITNHVNNFSDMWFPKHLPFLDAEIINPPSPPSDSPLDWDAMGVVTGASSVPNTPLEQCEDVFLININKPEPLNNVMMDKNTKAMDNFFSNKHLDVGKKRLSEPPPPRSPVTKYVSQLIESYGITKPALKEPSNPEIRIEPRIEPMVEKTVARQISQEHTKFDKYLKRPEKEPELLHNVNAVSHIKRRQDINEETTVKEEKSGSKDESFKMENMPSSRKPVILRLPHTEDTSSLSDIMKRMKQKQSTYEHPREHTREHPREHTREPPREHTREPPREHTREPPREHTREPPREHTREPPREHTREPPREHTRGHPREHTRGPPREHTREHTRDHPKDHTREPPWERSKTAFSELSRSLMDVSVPGPERDEKTTPVPRFRAGTLDVELVTPALALMQKRNDHIRTALYRSPLNFQPRERPRSYAFSPDWKGSLSELDTKDEGH